MHKVPLFPLNTVLFPNAQLSLHIFEERYRQMIGRCLEQKTPFGVVLLREGDEIVEDQPTNNPPVPHAVGTLAHINEHLRLDDGRFLLSTVGKRRFRIQYLLQSIPYLVGSVAFLSDDPSPQLDSDANDLRAMYERYWQAMADATGVQASGETLPDDALSLSYHLADRLQVSNERKQRWLEMDTHTRLRDILTVLRTEVDLLPTARRRTYFTGTQSAISLN